MKKTTIILCGLLLLAFAGSWTYASGTVIRDNGIYIADYRVVRYGDTVIAASNSPHKQWGDYVCDGVNDEVEIQQAINSLTDGGKISLQKGDYYVYNPINVTTPVVISGIGKSTYIHAGNITFDDTQPSLFSVKKRDVVIEHMQMAGNGTDFPNGPYRGILVNMNIANVQLVDIDTHDFYAEGLKHGGDYGIVDRVNATRNGDDGIVISTGTGTRVSNCYAAASGRPDSAENLVYQGQNSGIELEDGANHVSIVGCVLENQYFHHDMGIEMHGHPDQPKVSHVTITGCTFNNTGFGTGYYTGFSQVDDFITITGNDLYNATATIRSNSYVEISNNVWENENKRAIEVYAQNDTNEDYVPHNINIQNNIFKMNGTTATNTLFFSKLKNAVISGNNINASNSDAAINFYPAKNNSFDNIDIHGNYIRAKYQDIRFSYAAPGLYTQGNFTIYGNIFDTWSPTAVKIYQPELMSGTIFGNLGYTTENQGNTTLAASSTTVVVPHGLRFAPTNVYLSPLNSTAGKYYWVSAKTDTNFTISIDSAAGAPILFDWYAIRR